MDVFRTMVVTADDAPLARQLAASIDPTHSDGMWTTALAAEGEPTVATHYVSTGFVSSAFASVLPLAEWSLVDGVWTRTGYLPGNPASVVAQAAALDPPLVVTEASVAAMFARSDVTTDDPWAVFRRMGLVMVSVDPGPEPMAQPIEAPVGGNK